LRQQNERCHNLAKPLQAALNLQKDCEDLVTTQGQILLHNVKMMRDDESCFVCGLATETNQLEDDNDDEIGFCDRCGVSVHTSCYAIDKDAFKDEFICDLCQAFGVTNGMLVKCEVCQ
jgi:hypothetical protein